LDDIVAFLTLFFIAGLLWLVLRQYKKATLEITRRKKTEEALNRLNRELGERVERRAAALKAELEERKRAEEQLIDNQEQLRLLSSSLLTAEESERKRISLELHDDLGQSLNVLKLRMQSMKRNLRDDQEQIHQGCQEVLSFVDRIIEDLRRLSRDLRPGILDDLGLTTALLSLTEDYARHSDIEVSLDVQGIDRLFPQESQILIYRIFQEAFSNIEKHAGAANILVSFERENGVARFLIEDDGKGFDVKAARVRHPAGKGIGLAAMDERARMMGGSLIISSEENRGTRVSLIVPVSRGRQSNE
jgi:signal transduction histidine kinase